MYIHGASMCVYCEEKKEKGKTVLTQGYNKTVQDTTLILLSRDMVGAMGNTQNDSGSGTEYGS